MKKDEDKSKDQQIQELKEDIKLLKMEINDVKYMFKKLWRDRNPTTKYTYRYIY